MKIGSLSLLTQLFRWLILNMHCTKFWNSQFRKTKELWEKGLGQQYTSAWASPVTEGSHFCCCREVTGRPRWWWNKRSGCLCPQTGAATPTLPKTQSKPLGTLPGSETGHLIHCCMTTGFRSLTDFLIRLSTEEEVSHLDFEPNTGLSAQVWQVLARDSISRDTILADAWLFQSLCF